MGWTGLLDANGLYRKPSARKQFIDHMISYESDTRAVTVLKSSMVGTTYYAACRFDDYKQNTSVVTAVVVLTHYVRRAWDYEFQYKEMTEDVGPVEDRCPVTILKMLDPTDSEYALDWRKRCQRNIEASRAKRKEAAYV